MIGQKQLINVIGALVVVAVLAAGALLVALPMFLQSKAVSEDTRTVVETNALYDVQVQSLRAGETALGATERSIALLRAEIPSVAVLDDVFELVGSAATATGAVVESAIADPPQPWTLFLPAVSAADGGPTDDGTGVPAAAEAPVDDPADDSAAAEDSSTTEPDPAATDAAAASPETQVPVTVIVLVSSAEQAAAYIDALGAGPRLLGIVHSQLTEDEQTKGLRLVVNVLAFVRSEN